MFNALTPAEVVLSVGRVTREAAGREGAPDEYGRSQLLSAYSVSRHLAAEETARPGLVAWFTAAVVAELDESHAGRVREAADPAALGAALAEALEALREDPDAQPRRERIHALLRELADREVAALASPPR